MAKKLTLEERAAKKFPCPNDASDKERNSILAMQKAWIRVEQVRQEEQEKKKRQADRDALKLGQQLLQQYPYLTSDKIIIALETEGLVKELSRLTYFDENHHMKWRDGAKEIYKQLTNRYK